MDSVAIFPFPFRGVPIGTIPSPSLPANLWRKTRLPAPWRPTRVDTLKYRSWFNPSPGAHVPVIPVYRQGRCEGFRRPRRSDPCRLHFSSSSSLSLVLVPVTAAGPAHDQRHHRPGSGGAETPFLRIQYARKTSSSHTCPLPGWVGDRPTTDLSIFRG